MANSTSNYAYDHDLPCLNPHCKSHGKPHPNCKCYGGGGPGDYAEGGLVCDGPHEKDCEYYQPSDDDMVGRIMEKRMKR